MSKALSTTGPKTSALAVMAQRFNVDPNRLLSTLKSTVFKNASDDELMALCIVANEYGLNPILKEIYAFPAKGGGITPIVSIDGWINIINSHPQFDGVDFEMNDDEQGGPIACTAVIYRKDRSRPIRVTEYFAECVRPTEPWKMKHRMLRHKALIQCARVAFGFSGIYDEDEAADIKAVQGVVIEKPLFTGAEATAAEPVPVLQESAEPPKASPRQALENLMKASYIDESQLLLYIAGQSGEEYAALSAVDSQMVDNLIANWAGVVEDITGGAK